MNSQELKDKRLSLCLTQAQLALRLGVQLNTVSRWERGVHAVPQYLEFIDWERL